jgi:hypothetical protein
MTANAAVQGPQGELSSRAITLADYADYLRTNPQAS